MDLGLEARAQAHELVAVADQLPQLAHLGRGDPGLGQAAQAQEVDQVGGVTLVVLHPPVAPVVAERMGQVDPGAALGEEVGSPVPPKCRFQNHVGFFAGGGHRLGHGDRVVVDVDLGQQLAVVSPSFSTLGPSRREGVPPLAITGSCCDRRDAGGIIRLVHARAALPAPSSHHMKGAAEP